MSNTLTMLPISDKFYTIEVYDKELHEPPHWQQIDPLYSFEFQSREFFVRDFDGFGFSIIDALTGRAAHNSWYGRPTEHEISAAIEAFEVDHADTDFNAVTTGKAISPRYTSDVTLEIKAL